MNELALEMEAEALAARQEAAEKLTELALCNEMLSPLEKRKKELTDWLKQHMALEGIDHLGGIDSHEQPITARLHDRKGTPTYDVVTLVESPDGCDALVNAANAGMVRVDHQMLSRFRDKSGAEWADQIARFEMPGTGSIALVIERHS